MEPEYIAFRRWLYTPCSSSDVRWLDPLYTQTRHPNHRFLGHFVFLRLETMPEELVRRVSTRTARTWERSVTGAGLIVVTKCASKASQLDVGLFQSIYRGVKVVIQCCLCHLPGFQQNSTDVICWIRYLSISNFQKNTEVFDGSFDQLRFVGVKKGNEAIINGKHPGKWS